MPLTDLHHVALRTKDLTASEHFYTQVLGMEKVDRPDFDPRRWVTVGRPCFTDGRLRSLARTAKFPR